MKKKLFQYLALINLLVGTMFVPQVMAAEFHVTNATQFQSALDTAETNGEDDTIYLAAGIYRGRFEYKPPDSEHKSLTITSEPGLNPDDVILDAQDAPYPLRIYDERGGAISDLKVIGLTVQNGRTGGLIISVDTYNILIRDCVIKNNISQSSGGGLFIDTFKKVTLENNLITNNELISGSSNDEGGGVCVTRMEEVIFTNNIITKNKNSKSNSKGGGVIIKFSDQTTIHLIGNTIYGNQADNGGGVYCAGAAAINFYNNIIYGNTAQQGGDIYFEDSVVTRHGYNNNYSNMHGIWTSSGNNLDTTPLFVDPANNDFHLQPNSPMINAGTTVVPNPPGLPVTDFEGNPRVVGPAPDIGAYERKYLSVHPFEGTTGTETSVSGYGFGAKKGKVLIGNATLTILQWTDGSIQCKLTKALPPGPYDVTIRPTTKGASPIMIEDGFTVKAPEIDSVDPTSGSTGDEITINGFFFGTKKGKVTLGERPVRFLVGQWLLQPEKARYGLLCPEDSVQELTS